MLRIAGREVEGWLREKDIEEFPCIDLLTIDRLWVKYSQGCFGFSVQKEIWQSLGGTKNAHYEIYYSAAERLGWREGGLWLYYCDLTFNTTAPNGHLPGGLLDWSWSSYRESRLSLIDESADGATRLLWWHVWKNIISSLALRLEECKIQYPAWWR